MPYKLERLPRNRRGEYGIKARIPGVAAKSFRGRTPHEVEQAANQWAGQMESGKDQPAAETTLSEYRDEYLGRAEWRRATRQKNDALWTKYIEPEFGDYGLKEIRKRDIANWMVGLKKDGLSANVRKLALGHLQAMLTDAVVHEALDVAPDTRSDKPKVKPARGIALSIDQLATLEKVMPPRYRAPTRVAAGCGLRMGELTALKLDDVDFAQGLIRIDEAHQRGSGGDVLDETKTESSNRTIPLDRVVAIPLQQHLDLYGPSDDGFIFTATRPSGARLTYNAFQTAFSKAVARLERASGFPHATPHDLRHSFGSHLLNLGVAPARVAQLMGHANAKVTLEVYAHSIPGDDKVRQAMAEMARQYGLPDPPPALQSWTPTASLALPTTTGVFRRICALPTCRMEFEDDSPQHQMLYHSPECRKEAGRMRKAGGRLARYCTRCGGELPSGTDGRKPYHDVCPT
jgi:integrase